MIWCPWPSPETSYCSVPYSSAHLSLHFHYRSCSERGRSKSNCLYTLFIVVSYFGEKKRSWALSVSFCIIPICYKLGFTCGEHRIGEVSDIFRGVRGEGTELAGTPNTLSQAEKQLCGAIPAPALVAQGASSPRHLPAHCPSCTSTTRASSSSFPSLLGSASSFPLPSASPWVVPCSTGRVTCRKS